MSSSDLVITWPKRRPLASYLETCRVAAASNKNLNYRVSRRPQFEFGAHEQRRGRVYVVYDGFIRGYHELLYIIYRESNEVEAVEGGYWPAGWYLVRDPHWHPIEPIAMQGFRGWRYY